jgi:hypothetical protein
MSSMKAKAGITTPPDYAREIYGQSCTAVVAEVKKDADIGGPRCP